MELDRLRVAGMPDLDAWMLILRDERLGYADLRVLAEIPPTKISATFAGFLQRVTPGAVAEARDRVQERISRAAPEAAQKIVDLARGDFGEGRVRIRGRGDGAFEVVEIDASAAAVQLAASKHLLACVGVSDRPQSVTAVQVNQQVNVVSAHDLADAIDRDPSLREKAIDVARGLGVDGQASAPA